MSDSSNTDKSPLSNISSAISGFGDKLKDLWPFGKKSGEATTTTTTTTGGSRKRKSKGKKTRVNKKKGDRKHKHTKSCRH
jgi:hypothetical protein